MKYVISFSGGLGSAVSTIIAWENSLDYVCVFADTLIEDEDLYRFTDDIQTLVGQPIIRLKDGRTPWDVFVDRKYIGNTRLAHCSTELKTKPIQRYVTDNYSPDEATLILGMDYSEMDRIDRARQVWKPFRVDSLINRYKVFRPSWPGLLDRYGIRIPRLYDQGFPHNNCGGFCVKAGQKQFLTLLQTNPDRYAYHEAREAETMSKIGDTARPFLRRNVDGQQTFLTLRKFRELVEADEININPYDYGGCGCFIDDQIEDHAD